jgi:hypothetical protein
MSHLAGKFVVAVISNDETRIWETNATKGTAPDIVKHPGEERFMRIPALARATVDMEAIDSTESILTASHRHWQTLGKC